MDRYQDAVRLGSLLFVAAGPEGLRAVDLSHPRIPRPWPFAGTDGDTVALRLAFSGSVRGVDLDPHGRVLDTGGGEQGFGVLRLTDPLLVDPAQAVDAASAQPQLSGAVLGSTIITDPVSGTDTQLPSGLPRRVTALSWDAATRFTAGLETPPGLTFDPTQMAPLDDVTLTISGTEAGLQTELDGVPVTVRNLTRGRLARTTLAVDGTGQGTWSLQIPARRGDQIEIRRNARTVAYVAAEGAGLAVVDLAALHQTTSDAPGAAQIVGYQAPLVPPSEPICDPNRPFISGQPVAVHATEGRRRSPARDVSSSKTISNTDEASGSAPDTDLEQSR